MDNINYDEIERSLIKNREVITYYVENIKMEYKHFDKNNKKGIYVFWYYNKNNKIEELNRKLIIKGTKNVNKEIIWDWNLSDEYICLYVGKTENLKNRISQHMLLKTENLINKINDKQLYKKTTTCQLRSGFDYLYSKKNNINIMSEIKEHIYLSLYYEDDFVKRFFIEDYFIGKLRPWFNVDSER